LVFPVRLVPFSSKILGPPLKFYPSPRAFVEVEEGKYQVLFESETLLREPPSSIYEQPHWMLRREYQHRTPEAGIVHIPKGRVWVSYNPRQEMACMAFMSQQDRVIGDISYGFGFLEKLQNNLVFGQFSLGKPSYIPGRVVVLSSIRGELLYHWITDVLPKLHMLEKSGLDWESIDAVLINRFEAPFAKATLKLLGIPEEKLLSHQDYPHVEADEIICVTKPCYVAHPRLWMREYLKDRFLPFVSPDSSAYPERIYISRSDASIRRVTNEAEIEALLHQYGFTTVKLADLSFEEQIAHLHHAKMVVGPHGAGFTHLLFAQAGTKVIEFFHAQYMNVCYYNIANLVDLEYHYIIGEGFVPPEGVDLFLANADIQLDPQKLEQTLQMAGIRKPSTQRFSKQLK
jgi:hypothetical protein